MDLSSVNNHADKMEIPSDTRSAILHLIDIKINNDMEKILQTIQQSTQTIKDVEKRMEQNSIALREKMNNDNEALRREWRADANGMRWFLGMLIAIVVALGSVIVYMFQRLMH